MNFFGSSVFGFIVAIAILVTVHEFGHFWVARRLGIKVLCFSIGFGKTLFRWRRNNDPTEYRIAMIPLGGYVKMLDERESNVAPQERHLAFNRQPLWARSAVVIAGPLFNFIFAILAIWFVFIVGNPDIKAEIGQVETGSLAQQLGFQAGDRLLSVDGKPTHTWSAQQLYLQKKAMESATVTFAVENSSGARNIDVDFGLLERQTVIRRSPLALLGLFPSPPAAQVSRLVEGGPAQTAGLQSGDVIVAVSGQPVNNWVDLIRAISPKPEQEIVLKILRQQQLLDIALMTRAVEIGDQRVGQIGIYAPPWENASLQFGLFDSFIYSLDYNWQMTTVSIKALWQIITAKMSVENLSGPISIATIAGQTVSSGYIDFIKFLAIISISLGIFNLLPIPALDGGHLVYFLIELITGKQPSEKVMLVAQQFGFSILIVLTAVVFYNDIMRLFS